MCQKLLLGECDRTRTKGHTHKTKSRWICSVFNETSLLTLPFFSLHFIRWTGEGLSEGADGSPSFYPAIMHDQLAAGGQPVVCLFLVDTHTRASTMVKREG